MANFTLPSGLNYTNQLAPGIPGLRRTIDNAATTQNVYRPAETAIIPLSTGDGGAFWATDTVRLRMQVDILNYSSFIDFISLGPCGFHSIIKRMAIEINGYEHEVQDYYNWSVTTEMIQRGENCKPFEIVRSNTWEVAGGLSGIKHINFIKPSMVTSTGLPHSVIFPKLLNSVGVVADNFTQSLMYYSNPYASIAFGTSKQLNYHSTNANVDRYYKAPYNFLNFGGFHTSNWLTGGLSWYIDSTENYKYLAVNHAVVEPGLTTASAVANNTSSGSSNALDYSFNNKALYPGKSYDGQPAGADVNLSTPRVTLVLPGTNALIGQDGPYYKFVGGPSKTMIGLTYKLTPGNGTINIGNVSFGQSVDQFTPLQWPVKQPIDLEKLKYCIHESLEDVNQYNVMSYYANCKNIPVSKPLDLQQSFGSTGDNGASKVWGSFDFSDQTNYGSLPMLNPTVAVRTPFFIELKIYSSIIGEKAKVWFPETIFQQGTVKLKILFEDPNIAFQITSDPCRKVPGTPRDAFPNLGVLSTYGYTITNGNVTARNIKTIAALDEVSPIYLLSGVHPIMVTNYVPGQCFNDSICLGTAILPIQKFDVLHNLAHIHNIYNQLGVDAANTNHFKSITIKPLPNTDTAAGQIDQTVSFPGTVGQGDRSFTWVSYALSAITNEIYHNLRIGTAPIKYTDYDVDTGLPTPRSDIDLFQPNTQAIYGEQITDLKNYYRPASHHTWLATVGARVTPTRITMNPPIIFPSIFYLD